MDWLVVDVEEEGNDRVACVWDKVEDNVVDDDSESSSIIVKLMNVEGI